MILIMINDPTGAMDSVASILLRLPRTLRREFKRCAAIEYKTMNEVLVDFITAYVDSFTDKVVSPYDTQPVKDKEEQVATHK